MEVKVDVSGSEASLHSYSIIIHNCSNVLPSSKREDPDTVTNCPALYRTWAFSTKPGSLGQSGMRDYSIMQYSQISSLLHSCWYQHDRV